MFKFFSNKQTCSEVTKTSSNQIPQNWLKEAISLTEATCCYDIEKAKWDTLLEFYSQDCEIWKFDSGFCIGLALLRDNQTVSSIVTAHYSRQRE
jgi:hypothetical protein